MEHRHQIPEVDLEALLDSGDVAAVDRFLARLHPADLALVFGLLDRDHWPTVLKRMSISETSRLMEELPEHLRDDLAEHLKHDQLTRVIEEMASDDAADVLGDLPEQLAKDLIRSLAREDRREVETLLQYPEDSAGGLMQTELVSVPESATADQAVEAIRAHADEVGDFHFVYVVAEDRRLAGVLRLAKLVQTHNSTPIRELMEREPHVVTPEVDQEHVAQIFKRYDLVALPVVDTEGRLLGRILHDDVVDVLEAEADEDILQIAGAGPHEPELVYTDQLWKIATVRLPWLLVTMLGLNVTALLYWRFQLTFPQTLALIPFIPVISAMGGNVGAQSSIIVVRGFATGRVDLQGLGRFLGRELVIALLMGIACGLVAGLVALIWHGEILLGATVSVAMIAALVVAATVGVLVPYLFRRIGVDPAIAAGPLVTTFEDILATSIYFLFALLIIAH
jgi:magnesium transporter